MNSDAEQPNLVLIRQVGDGQVEWLPLEIPTRAAAASEADYALVDRAIYEAPETLVARRDGDDLVIEVQGTEVLTLSGFFAADDVAFYPTTDIASGAGPFSREPLTQTSGVMPGSAEQIVWSAEPGAGEQVARAEDDDPERSGADDAAGGTSPMLWGGLGLGGLLLAAAAGGGGGGGGGGGDDGGGGTPPPATPEPPAITSGDSAGELPENSGAGQVVYTATADDATVTWSLDGADAAAFSIDSGTGEVTLTENPDFETKSSYSFTVVATDPDGNSASQTVGLSITDQDDSAPFINSGAVADPIDENSDEGQLVYTASAQDDGTVTWSLAPEGDSENFEIDEESGEVKFEEEPDYERQSSYTFTVVATDDEDNVSQQRVTLTINNVDEVAPTITSGSTAAVDEDSGAGQVVYTVTSTDDGDISTGATTYSLTSAGDGDEFEIDSATGEVTLIENPDFDRQSSYTFTVRATDAAGNSSDEDVTLTVNDVDAPPVITSGATADPIEENSGAGQVVYTATATDDGTVTWSLAGTHASAFTIDANSGVVTLTNDPDFETQSSYAFTVVATDDGGNTSELDVTLTITDVADETPPTLASSTPGDNAVDVSGDSDIVLTFSETVVAGDGDITISDGTDTRTIDVSDGSQVTISGNQVTINPTDNLRGGTTYSVQIDPGAFEDAAGLPYAGISDDTTLNFDTFVDTSVVVFDLVQGSSSDHSGRTFQSGVSYDIYIRVDSNSEALSTAGGGPGTWDTWSGAANLGSDDRVILVGDGAPVEGFLSAQVNSVTVDTEAVSWRTPIGAAGVLEGTSFERVRLGSDNTDLFDTSLPAAFLGGQGGQIATMYATNMPSGILTSQGLI